MANIQRYQEGGWGWLVALAGFTSEFIIYGTLKAFGVLLTTMKDDLDTDLWIIGSITALHYGVQFLLPPIVSALASRYSSRIVIMSGGVLYGLGLVISSLTYNAAVIATSLIVLAGVGSSCPVFTIRSELAFYFYDKFGLAICVILIGGPTGFMFYGPVTQVLLDTYGWRGAMLLLGGVGFSLIWCGLLVRRPTGIYAIIPNRDLPTNDDSNDNQLSEHQATHDAKTKCGSSLMQTFGFDILTNLRFILVTGIRVFYNASYCGVVVYMVPNALELGLSSMQASFLSTAFGVGSLVGLIFTALILHTKRLSLHAVAIISGGVAAIAMAFSPIVPALGGQMAIFFTVGAGLHSLFQTTDMLTRNLPFSDDRFITVFGWAAFFAGISSSIGDVFAGWVYNTTHSFFGTFLLFSTAMMLSVICCVMDALYIRFIQRSRAKPNE